MNLYLCLQPSTGLVQCQSIYNIIDTRFPVLRPLQFIDLEASLQQDLFDTCLCAQGHRGGTSRTMWSFGDAPTSFGSRVLAHTVSKPRCPARPATPPVTHITPFAHPHGDAMTGLYLQIAIGQRRTIVTTTAHNTLIAMHL